MDVKTALINVLLGMVLGMIGQGIRIVVGLKKAHDAKKSENFKEDMEMSRMLISLLIGAVAGGLAAVSLLETDEVTRQQMLSIVAIGYSGADFIEGFMRRKLRA